MLQQLRATITQHLDTHSYMQGVDYQFILSRDQYMYILGIPDEYTAVQIQSSLLPHFPSYNGADHQIMGSRWSVVLYTYNPDADPDAPADANGESAPDDNTFHFYSQLVPLTQDLKARLSDEGIVWMADYQAIDADHEFAGVTVEEITDEATARQIQQHLIRMTGFPFTYRHLHHNGWMARARTLFTDQYETVIDREELLDVEPEQLDTFLQQQQGYAVHKEPPYRKIDEMLLEIGYGLISAVDELRGGTLLQEIQALRDQMCDCGIFLPFVKVKDNMKELDANEYRLSIGEHQVSGELTGEMVSGQEFSPPTKHTTQQLLTVITESVLEHQEAVPEKPNTSTED